MSFIFFVKSSIFLLNFATHASKSPFVINSFNSSFSTNLAPISFVIKASVLIVGAGVSSFFAISSVLGAKAKVSR